MPPSFTKNAPTLIVILLTSHHLMLVFALNLPYTQPTLQSSKKSGLTIGILVKPYRILILSTLSLSLISCAIAPGLQTHDLPEQGTYTTEQGATLDIVQLTQSNLAEMITEQNTQNDIQALFTSTARQEYRLTVDDILSIQLWAYPEISPSVDANDANAKGSGYLVDSLGYIHLPLVGRIHVEGKSLAEVTRLLKSRFAQYLKTPDVIVRMASYQGQRYSVSGQVNRSGQYTLSNQPTSLYTALSMAGGINSETGDQGSILLTRQGKTYTINTLALEKQGYSLHKLLIQPNDSIYVNSKQNQKLYVLGESTSNQALPLRDQGMTLSDVLGESQGINPYTASAARIFVMRTDLERKHSTVYQLNLSSLGNLALANQFAMQKNDIVYIDATGLTRWQRIINQIVPFSSAIYSFDQIGK